MYVPYEPELLCASLKMFCRREKNIEPNAFSASSLIAL